MKDFFKLALASMRKRVLRTMLTMIGIFIGIAAVVALVSLGQGLRDAVNKEFSSVGGDKIIVQGKQAGFGPPGTFTPAKITDKDWEIIKKVPGVRRAAGHIFTGITIEFQKEQQTQFGLSLPEGKEELGLVTEAHGLEILKGRLLRSKEKGKINLGYSYGQAKGVFERAVEVGNTVLVQGEPFEVVGIFDRTGDPGMDKGVYPAEQDLVRLLGMRNEFNTILAQTESGLEPSKVADQIKKTLRKERRQKEGKEDFTVSTSEELIASFNRILTIVQAVIIGIAAISLLVGGVGIMNTMFTSVLERTREIGIMKAVGATNKNIMMLFLIESGLLGMMGGAIGVLIGIGMSKTVEFVAKQVWGPNLLQAGIPWYLVVGALLFSFLIGALSGVFPARQAARLKPVDALRYE
ncbi:ABC transporter permease [Candidatus Woesearchaeota archaeon]|nr:ABC transporter permease [Candidatus Woesearchaeota archaeon]